MPFGIGNLDFIDDAVDSVMGGLDDLFSNKEERQKARNELERIKKRLKSETQAHTRQVLKIHAKDRQHARNAQSMALKKAWWAMPLLMILTYVGFFGILVSLVFFDVDTAANQVLLVLLGTLGTIVTQIAQFLWGSSQGSKDKDEKIRRMMENGTFQANSGSADDGQKKNVNSPSVTVPKELEDM